MQYDLPKTPTIYLTNPPSTFIEMVKPDNVNNDFGKRSQETDSQGGYVVFYGTANANASVSASGTVQQNLVYVPQFLPEEGKTAFEQIQLDFKARSMEIEEETFNKY